MAVPTDDADVTNASEPELRRLGLTTDTTLPRALVHKRAVENVFLTAVRDVSGSPVVLAQLPRMHRYFNDTYLPYYDLLLIGEVERQAVEAIAHGLLGVPDGARFVIRAMAITLDDLPVLRVGAEPADLVIKIDIERARRRRNGPLHGMVGRASCWLGGRRAAGFTGTVHFVSEDGYAKLRADAAAAPDHGFPPHDRPVTPALVGRRDAANVVVSDLTVAADAAWTRLVVDPGHPVFFEHPQDHHPGTAVLEGCRQTAVAAASAVLDVPATRLLVTKCSAQFSGFAELGRITSCHAALTGEDDGCPVVSTRVTQHNTTVAEARMTVTAVDDDAMPVGGKAR
ncbi:AfsA-related hotdog domain-containing protein [Streptomyces cupreus]|uniref:A-factor biosynthesis hotdog domain-containing protein n=1 Tax=Streptomyces cupreus TaxID=2759956 RepID=A0A7X1MCH3_9ACTN|nr:AfsA-related hotdog domain-containing protein [Streptomyces cupreus]MBC2903685.1 hypothetical protein [Streptomyces cupreus]